MIPGRLKFGDTIGLVSPASPAEPSDIKKAITFFQDIGFKVKEGKHIHNKCGYLAGTDLNRASDIMDMFLDTDVSMILCIRGGYGTMRILPLLDYEIIKKTRKLFVGFSDITCLLNTLYSRCRLISFHGPMATSNFTDIDTCKSFFSTLMKGTRPYDLINPNGYPFDCSTCRIAEGKIVGGNLSLICSTIGTPYEIDTKENILFIEEVNEAPYAIDKYLTQLLLAKKLQSCSGFILGQFTNCTTKNSNNNFDLNKIIKDRLLSLNKPTLYNVMAGHDYPNTIIPIGAKAIIDCTVKKLYILEPVVK